MSTTIYDTIKLPPAITWNTLADFLEPARAAAKAALVLDLQQEIARLAVARLDLAWCHAHGPALRTTPSPCLPTAWDCAARELRKEIETAEESRRAWEMPRFEAPLFLYGDATGLYGLVRSHERSVAPAVRALPGAQGYDYWNNTDPAPGFSQEQWAARGEHWNALMGKRGAPWEHGLIAHLLPLGLGMTSHWIHEASKELPAAVWGEAIAPRARRAKRAAEETQSAAMSAEDEQALRGSEGVNAYFRHMKNLEKGHVPAFTAALESLQGALPDHPLAHAHLAWEDVVASWAARPALRPSP